MSPHRTIPYAPQTSIAGLLAIAVFAVLASTRMVASPAAVVRVESTPSAAHVLLGSMYGTRPGCYLVVGPGWSGVPPRGIAGVLRSPTRHAYCIPRVFFTAAEGDQAAAVEAAAGVMAYPLDQFNGSPRRRDWTKLRWLPSLSREGTAVPPDRFLEILPDLLDDVPPLPGE